MIGGIFRLGGGSFIRRVTFRPWLVAINRAALTIAPEDAHERAPPRRCDVVEPAQRTESVVLPALDRKGFAPMSIQALTIVGSDHEAAVMVRTAIFFEFERGPNLVA